MFIGYNYANGKYDMDEDHNAGNCAKKYVMSMTMYILEND